MTILETVQSAKINANALKSEYDYLRNIRAPQDEIAAALASWGAANDELNEVFFYLKKAMGK